MLIRGVFISMERSLIGISWPKRLNIGRPRIPMRASWREILLSLLASEPALSDEQVARVAELARRTERHFGRPQDIEWSMRGGEFFLLQSRPITSLVATPDPDGIHAIWDNSNIVESYSGITTPLTFSFALHAYEGVYREFCRLLGVPKASY